MGGERKERWPTSVSVAILLQNGSKKFGPVGNFDHGLVLVHKRDSGLWGPPAGGLEAGEGFFGSIL